MVMTAYPSGYAAYHRSVIESLISLKKQILVSKLRFLCLAISRFCEHSTAGKLLIIYAWLFGFTDKLHVGCSGTFGVIRIGSITCYVSIRLSTYCV